MTTQALNTNLNSNEGTIPSLGILPFVLFTLTGGEIMVNQENLKLVSASDPKGRLALEKFLETASRDQIIHLSEILKDTPKALSEFASALDNLREIMKDMGGI